MPAAFGDRFVVDALVGEGGMGHVFRAHDRVLSRPVAVKLLRNDLARDTAFVTRFFHEAKVVAALSANPNVVSIYDVGTTGEGTPYLVMEYLEGVTLRTAMGAFDRPDRSWVFDVGTQIAAALVDAHAQGVVHRDLKPENVFVIDSRTLPFLIKVLDFGLARSVTSRLPSEHATQPGSLVGTPQYMAPELAVGEKPVPASDVYALGIMLYEIVAGRSPYRATSAVEFVRAHVHDEPLPLDDEADLDEKERLPSKFRELVFEMLAKDARQRPEARDVLYSLQRMRRVQESVLAKATIHATGALDADLPEDN